MDMHLSGHHIHDIGDPGCPYLECKNCNIDYLELDSMGFPRCDREPTPVVPKPSGLQAARNRIAAQVSNARYQLRQAWLWLRFGAITETVKSVDGGVVSEIEYRGRNGTIVGYWAYGDFDPAFPYRG